MARPVEEAPIYRKIRRPGFFGRRRDEIVRGLNIEFGLGKWTLVWDDGVMGPLEFADACKYYYEQSYIQWFGKNPHHIDIIASYRECIDNANSNITSGCDYTKQEAGATHLQDIAIRNVLRHFNRSFCGSSLLVIRSSDSNGGFYSPGKIPFMRPDLVSVPSKHPRWADPGSVEDFWQSNKWIAVREC